MHTSELLQRLMSVYGNDTQSIRDALTGLKSNEFKSGGKIHIKPENRGKFTALKKRTGHSATWFKLHGTPAQKKMAVFELNSRKWKHEDGGPLEQIGGYSTPIAEREAIYNRYDPTDGYNWVSALGYLLGHRNTSRGEENEYWRAYLGLPNNVPSVNKKAILPTDANEDKLIVSAGMLPPEYYGTTDRMDQMIQMIADTGNVGNIVRNYDTFLKDYPNIASRGTLNDIYLQGKAVMDNPGVWQHVGEANGAHQPQLDIELDKDTNESAPLGMLGTFSMKWEPNENAIYVQDQYDFTKPVRVATSIPQRPRLMKIRGRINYDPKKGSVLLRGGKPHFDLIAPPIADKNTYR